MSDYPFRYTQLDPDNRRTAKTADSCVRCNRDLAPGQPRRAVHVIFGGACVLHPSDEAEYALIEDRGDLGLHDVGMDCARRIGLEFTSEAVS